MYKWVGTFKPMPGACPGPKPGIPGVSALREDREPGDARLPITLEEKECCWN